MRLAAGIPDRSIRLGPPMKLVRSSGVQLHPTSLPTGRLGAEAYAFVDWLHDAGQSWWQMLPLGPPDRYGSPYKAKSAFAAWPGLLAEPRAAVSKAEELDFRERNAAWIDDWIAHGGRGALADQVRFDREWAALRALRARPRREADRRRPDLRRARQRRPPGPPGALPGRRRRGHAARRLHRQGPAVGQPALRLARAAAPRLPLVGRAPAPHVRPLRPRPRRPLPRLRLLLGGARRAPATRSRGAGSAARAAPSSTPPRRSSATSP